MNIAELPPSPSAAHIKAALVVNTRSRKGRLLFKESADLLRAHGLEVSAYPVSNPDNLRQEVRRALEEGYRRIIVGGGDGTVSEVVDDLVHTDAVLGILPLGTANSFIRSLSIPLDLDGAAKVAATGAVAEIDLGMISGDYFANAASLGFATSVAESIPHELKRRLGIFAYAVQGVRSLRNLKPFTLKVEFAGETRTIRTFQVVVANGGYYGPSPLQAGRRLQSGDISIFTMENMSPLALAGSWLASLVGRKFSQQQVGRILVKGEAVLTADPPQEVSIDGEVRATTPITVGVAPKALKVLVPAPES
jgi:YegS/Rv2252/BmrU family lipid kinase